MDSSYLNTLLEQSNVGDPRVIHARAIRTAAADRCLHHRLITLYSKLPGLLPYSGRLFFTQIPFPNVVSWTSLISAHSASPAALRHFVSMLRQPTLPNHRTLPSLLRTCAALLCTHFGLSLHSLSVKLGLSSEPFTGSALLNFYFKCRSPRDALGVFDEMLDRDEVCYSAAIVGLAQNSRPVDALSVFAEMRRGEIGSTIYSISGALRAASEMAAMDQCGIIHSHAVVTGFDQNVVVASALIDGYGKSGLVLEARRVFDENLPIMNMVGWNAMMSGYAQQGDIEPVMELLHKMEGGGFVPDGYTFLAILSACYNSASSAEDVERWIARMRADYGLEPGLEHYTCLISAMARAGRLEDAKRLALAMPFEPDAAVWRSILMACRHLGDADKAREMAKRLLELNPSDDSAYVIASNALSTAGEWDEVAEVRKAMKDRRVRKEVGQSWVETRGRVHVFMAGDRRHERRGEIYAKLEELMSAIEQLGYEPIMDEMVHHESVVEAEKRERLQHHSEKLAAAFGLLEGVTPPGKALRIVKNLRICRDCHEVFMYISRVADREIIVRDANRYHRFSGGVCTCRDFW
ncbi:hypothetical protein CDL15_Pgr022017 [Punica granatum]|uniref:DYW domain-containing protein n=1 Tax=Punica granatum TaxID=22663 RepID=A0A218VTM6_PUNGR|nr:hypothetical protein CDL15_Pgr022017 [Punica granatum]PKI35113.1 hypothetical protein CRG98_044502 [Punica granatum]